MRNVPFFASFIADGEKEDNHCVQAVVRMILKYFEPKIDFTWDELDTASGKEPNLSTWEMDILLWLIARGYEVIRHTAFDYQAFIDRDSKYLKAAYGKEAADWQAKNSNIPQAVDSAKKFIKVAEVKKQGFTIPIIKKLLDQGYLIWAEVDSGTLNDLDMYIGHAVLVKGYTKDALILNDPGLPPIENRKVSYDDFLAAAQPNGYSLNAIKKASI